MARRSAVPSASSSASGAEHGGALTSELSRDTWQRISSLPDT